MTEMIDLDRVGDPVAVAGYANRILRGGRLVLFPTETGYALGASGLQAGAVARLRSLVPDQPLELVVAGLSAARDWVPELGAAGRRLARRFWPGAVTLISGEGVERGLIPRLEESLRAVVYVEERLHLRQPGHEVPRAMVDRLGAPLICASLTGNREPAAERQFLEDIVAQIDLVISDGARIGRQQGTAVEVNGGAWAIRRPGVVSAEEIREGLAFLILFVCTGNTCRSPLAEAICKKRFADRLGCAVSELPARGFLIRSAGLAAAEGMPAAREAVAVARAQGADLEQHQSRLLTPALAEQADLLLGMTSSHVEAIEESFSTQARLLGPGGEDVADPIGQPREVYEECAQQMTGYIDALVAQLLPASPDCGSETGNIES
jgi:protein-tyrosine phosphatase